MNSPTFISIILPVFNGEEYLKQSIESCLNQTFGNLELIIVNDASTDNSLDIALSYAESDKRVRIHNNDTNQNLPSSLNIGHKLAKGNLLTWTSHDNYFNPDAIEKMTEALEKNIADVVYTDYSIIEASGEFRRKVIHNKYSDILLGNIVGACFLYKREVFIRNGGYNENLYTVEDYDFWLRCHIHSKFYHLPEDLYNYRSHRNSLSSLIESKDSIENSNFKQKLKISYEDFFNNFSLSISDYPALFTSLHCYEKIDVYDFLKNYSRFKLDISFLEKEMSSFSSYSFWKNIDLRLRSNIQMYHENQNLKTLSQIFLTRPCLLTSYDRRRSLNYIRQCFSI